MAKRKLLITFLSLVVLFQLSVATPALDEDTKSTEITDEPVDLELYTVIEMNKVVALFVPKESQLLQEILEEVKANKDGIEADNELLSELEELIATNNNASSDALNWMTINLSIVDIFYEQDKESKHPRLRELLDNHGWRKIQNELDTSLKPKIDELIIKIKEDYSKLSDAEKEEKKGLSELVEQLDDKEGKDTGKLISLLLEYVIS